MTHHKSSSMHVAATPVLYVQKSPDDVVRALAEYVAQAQKEAIEKKGRFTVALSGGSLPKNLRGLIGMEGIDWDKWQVYYADERAVPFDHEDSNHGLCVKEFYSKVSIPEANIHPIDASLLEDLKDPNEVDNVLEELSASYEQALILQFASKDSARFPIFDLMLLGMGPDGHTCSLFPGHELLEEEIGWVAYLKDSPKPPPRRITLTLPVINHALRVVFVATGESKKGTLAKVLDYPELGLPCSRVRPTGGSVTWFTDEAAVGTPDEAAAEKVLASGGITDGKVPMAVRYPRRVWE